MENCVWCLKKSGQISSFKFKTFFFKICYHKIVNFFVCCIETHTFLLIFILVKIHFTWSFFIVLSYFSVCEFMQTFSKVLYKVSATTKFCKTSIEASTMVSKLRYKLMLKYYNTIPHLLHIPNCYNTIVTTQLLQHEKLHKIYILLCLPVS